MHKFWGKVRKGKNRGKKLGFPTANINLHRDIQQGVYISVTKIKSLKYPSITFIGQAKTFNESEYIAENFILNFNQNIYHKWIKVELIKKIRANRKFNSSKELIQQMEKDKEVADNFFKSWVLTG